MGEALVGVDPTSRQLVGELAESYELSDDGKTWTIQNCVLTSPSMAGWVP
jgi:ABC-type transport system substrate-binding protein